MSNKFKVGDSVIVRPLGERGYVEMYYNNDLTGLTGKIVSVKRNHLVGVEFSERFHQSLHDLNGTLKKNTGWYLHTDVLSLLSTNVTVRSILNIIKNR